MQTKTLITSALPYINGIKHLGNLVGSMLPADVHARYCRQAGQEVLFICGTDDHGAPAEIAAQQAEMSVEAYTAMMYEKQRSIYEGFSLSFDYFGRSSSAHNHQLTQAMFLDLVERGFIQEQTITQYYSIDDQRFLPDRFIEGTCPHCGYDKARGDQCDGCGSLLNPVDLKAPRSALTPEAKLELRETRHFFLDLPQLEQQVAEWSKSTDLSSKEIQGVYKKWLGEHLMKRCITRDLSWGVPVPKPGYEDKVFYVWFDAPNGYIAITMDWADKQPGRDWRSWWKNPDDVCYTQFMAKDNLPFHAIIWPAMLLGSGQDWTMVDRIRSSQWLTYEGGKFSTSQNRGIFCDKALELFPGDYWRFSLLANAPETSDADFSFKAFATHINSDLADALGNFISRVLTLVTKYFSAKVPAYQHQANPLESKAQDIVMQIDKAYQQTRYREVIQQLRLLWALGNEYITQHQPWSLAKTDLPAAAQVLSDCLHLIRIYAITLAPIVPNIADDIASVLPMSDHATTAISEAVNFAALPIGAEVATKKLLVSKITPEAVDELQQAFDGRAH